MNNKHMLSRQDERAAFSDARDGLSYAEEGFVFLDAVLNALYDLRLDERDDNFRISARKAHDLIRLGCYLSIMWRDSVGDYAKRADATLETLQRQERQ